MRYKREGISSDYQQLRKTCRTYRLLKFIAIIIISVSARKSEKSYLRRSLMYQVDSDRKIESRRIASKIFTSIIFTHHHG